MPSYVSQHDIVYLSPSYEGYEGFPVGNGDLGGMIWCTPTGFKIQVNKTDLWDEPNKETRALLRSCARLTLDFGAPCFEWLHLKEFRGRLTLHEAEAVFSSETPFMTCAIRQFVAAQENVWVIQCRNQGTGELKQGAVANISLERWGSRAFGGWYGGFSRDPEPGLGHATTGTKGKDVYLVEKLETLQFAVACRVLKTSSTSRIVSKHRVELNLKQQPVQDFTLLLSVATSHETERPLEMAIARLDEVESEGIHTTQDRHHEWWRQFWQRSFVHLGDDYIENLYYLKRYLMASSSRGRYPAVFNGAIWTWNHDVRNWVTPHHWNMQQSYWGLCAQNDCDLLRPYLDSYWRLMDQAQAHAQKRGAENAVLWSEAHDFAGRMSFWNRGDMLNNFTPASQIAGFFWEYYLYTDDETFLRKRAYPFMKHAAEFYLQYLQWNEEKQEYFIFPSQPYECAWNNQLLNPITDRVMIESLYRNCIAASTLLNIDSVKRNQWQKVLKHLWEPTIVDCPDIGEVFVEAHSPKGKPWWRSKDQTVNLNYHFSPHSAMVFPANLIGIDDKDSRYFRAVQNYVNHHPPEKNAITPDPIVAARMGMGEKTRELLGNSICRQQHFPQGLFYNIDHWYQYSRYAKLVDNPDVLTQRDYVYDRRCRYTNIKKSATHDGTPMLPFVQCGLEPLGILGAAVNEMLLQSYDKKIRIFPAVPEGWPGAFTLRTAGGFLVSSERDEKGQVPYILVKSLLGNQCTLINPWPQKAVTVETTGANKKEVPVDRTEENLVIFSTAKHTAYLIRPEQGKQVLRKSTTYTGQRNDKPKYFQEAILGKPRDF